MKFGPKRLVLESLDAVKRRGRDLDHCVVRALDLRGLEGQLCDARVDGSVFLGCHFGSDAVEALLVERGAALFPRPEGLPYDPYRKDLYTWRELVELAEGERGGRGALDRDLAIYEHFQRSGGHLPDLLEALTQRIHDHAIDEALREYLDFGADGLPRHRAVGIMGGHSTRRSDPVYLTVARLAQQLAAEGFLVVTGGGPGVMEAGNLGAYLGDESGDVLQRVVDDLAAADAYTDDGYRERALQVLDRFPRGRESLAIPTWFYGHEPSNVFATAIAKYFSNSLREDGLLALCVHGVVFAPGSAGTTQEIFMDAVQNHYGSLGWISPMVFLGTQRYSEETRLYPLLESLARGRRYEEFLLLTDSAEVAVDFLLEHPPVRVRSPEDVARPSFRD